MPPQSRIMYIEFKGDGIVGPARIGRISSIRGKSLQYQGKRFVSLRGAGFKANYFELETKEQYWISGCKKDGTDALYSTTVEIDDDVREEYWCQIRSKPGSQHIKSFKCAGKYSR